MASDESFREHLYTIRKDGSRKWVYPRIVHSGWRRYRALVAYTLMIVYIGTPWITVANKQAVLFDLVRRELTLFGYTFWATDTYFITLILAGLAVSLFFFSALLGRIWCGWACPETVFLEFLFRPIETLIEGGPAERLRRDQGPWTAEKLRVKTLKGIICGSLVWVLASTAVIYCVGTNAWLTMITGSPAENWTPFVMTVIMMAFLSFQFGWFREQFCTVLCPYARFQSVLLDPHSLLVGYDRARGEPRGKPGKVRGDCVDCGLCVRVCPTGIDIRNGLQLECIQCGACADACDTVMQKLDRAPGLVRYDSEANLEGRGLHILRPRTIAYGLILALIGIAFIFSLSTRSEIDLHILRARSQQTFNHVDETVISNQMLIEIGNKGSHDRTFKIYSEQNGRVEAISPLNPLTIKAGSMQRIPLFLNFPAQILDRGRLKTTIVFEDRDGEIIKRTVTLLGPG